MAAIGVATLALLVLTPDYSQAEEIVQAQATTHSLPIATLLFRKGGTCAAPVEGTSIQIGVGDTITWTNCDILPHSITPDVTGTFPDSNLFGKDKQFSQTFGTAGTYAYHCKLHFWMKGTVVVGAGQSVTSTTTASPKTRLPVTPNTPNTGGPTTRGGGTAILLLAAAVALALLRSGRARNTSRSGTSR